MNTNTTRSAEPLIQRAAEGGADLPTLVKAAVVCAKAVSHLVPKTRKRTCRKAIEAAETWASNPTDANARTAWQPSATGAGPSWAAQAATGTAKASWAAVYTQAAASYFASGVAMAANNAANKAGEHIDFHALVLREVPELTAYAL